MTGFAEASGSDGSYTWRWEMRGVNARGLDIRLRLAEGCEALEPELRALIGKAFRRGTLNVALRLSRQTGAAALQIDEAAALRGLAALERLAGLAAEAGVAIAPPALDRLAAMPGVFAVLDSGDILTDSRRAALMADAESLVGAMREARQGEGAALRAIIAARIDEIERLAGQARELAEARAARDGTLLRERVQALLGAGAPIDEARLAQELALIAVRIDVTEELDRLEAHVAAARALLAAEGPVGRKFDFLAQEFNREANTLCSKASSAELTAAGLELKSVIDQLREQIQNVE